MARHGSTVDAGLVETAALLHDLDKALPADHPLKPLGHAGAGAEWLRRAGFSELAPAVAAHPVMELGNAETYESWSERAALAGRVVTYSDKRARQDVLTLDERFAIWHEQHPDSPALALAQERARRLELEICELAGMRPEDVERLSWVAEAMHAAA